MIYFKKLYFFIFIFFVCLLRQNLVEGVPLRFYSDYMLNGPVRELQKNAKEVYRDANTNLETKFQLARDALDSRIASRCSYSNQFEEGVNVFANRDAVGLFASLNRNSNMDDLTKLISRLIYPTSTNDVNIDAKVIVESVNSWITMVALGIVTLIFVSCMGCAQQSFMRKCFGTCFCRIWCVDHPRRPFAELAFWKKITISTIFIVLGVIIWFTFTIIAGTNGALARAGLNAVECDLAQTQNALLYGTDNIKFPKINGASVPRWKGLQEFRRGAKDVAEGNTRVSFMTAATEMQTISDTKMNQLGVDSVALEKSLTEAKRIAYTDGDHIYAAYETLGYHFPLIYGFRTGVLNWTQSLSDEISNDLESSSFTAMTDSAQQLLTNSEKLTDKALESVNSVTNSRIITSIGTVFYWAGVMICLIALGVMLFTWVTAALWGRMWFRKKNPSHTLKNLTCATYCCYGSFAGFVLISGSLLFALLQLSTTPCFEIESQLSQRTFNLENDVAVNTFWDECISTNGSGTFEAVTPESNSLQNSITLIDNFERKLSAEYRTEALELNQDFTLNKALDDFAAINWLFLTSPSVWSSSLGIPEHILRSGIQDTTQTVLCSSLSSSLQDVVGCTGSTGDVTILGMKEFQDYINSVSTEKIFCISPKLCGVAGSSAEPITSDTDLSQYNSTPEIYKLLALAQKKYKLLTEPIFICEGGKNCTVNEFATVNSHQYAYKQSRVVFRPLTTPGIEEFCNDAFRPLTYAINGLRNAFNPKDLNCRFLHYAVTHVIRGACKIALPSLAMVALSSYIFWISGFILAITSFITWHYAHNSLFVAPEFTGPKDADTITEVHDNQQNMLQ